MDENLHNIEDLFHSALDDNEEMPSQHVWEAVDKRLDKDNIVIIKRKYTNIKRIAVLLLFMLVSFILYDVYKTNNTHSGNAFAKNNATNYPGSNSKSDKVANNTTIKKADDISAKAPDTKSTLVTAKENVVSDNSVRENENSTYGLETKSTNNPILLKQNTNDVFNPDRNISENQSSFTSNQKKIRSSKSPYRVKIKNTFAAQDEQILVRSNTKQEDIAAFMLRELRNISIENVQLLPYDSVSTKKLVQILAMSKTQISDSIINSLLTKTIKKKQVKSSGVFITPFFSPDIAWYRLQDDQTGNHTGNANELEREEKHEFSSTYGALIDYKINRYWGIQSGVTVSNTNITVEPKTIYAQQDNTGNVKYRINTSSGYGYVLPSFSSNPSIGDSLYAFTSTHSLRYIGIPLSLTYGITKGKFRFNGMAGVSANILTRAKLETTVEKGFNNSIETLDNLQGLRKIQFDGLAGVGVDYKLTNKMSLTLAPTMRFSLNSITKDAPVKSYPMTFGFAMGFKFGL